MNYLAEILSFENWIEYNSQINKSDIRLWYALMHTANRFNWSEFTVPISKLISKSKLNKDAIYRARNKLKQFGLIEFKERGGNQCAAYKMKSVVAIYGVNNAIQSATENAIANQTQSQTQNANINKTKNQKLKTKKETTNVAKKKFGEFKNVLLTEAEFERLKADYGEELGGIIEHFSNYIEMKGYKAKSHNLAIRNWVVTAYREKKQREIALENRVKGGANNAVNRRNTDFNEYPEYDTYGTDDPEKLAEEIKRIKEKCANG